MSRSSARSDADHAVQELQKQFRAQLRVAVAARSGRGGTKSVADDLGVDERTITDWLNGNIGLSLKTIYLAAKTLDFTLEYDIVRFGRGLNIWILVVCVRSILPESNVKSTQEG